MRLSVPWSFARREMRNRKLVFLSIILTISVVVVPFSVGGSFQSYLDSRVRYNIENSLSSQVTLALPKDIQISDAANGNSFLIKDAEQRAAALRDRGLNASVRGIALQKAMFRNGVVHEVELIGIDKEADRTVCNLTELVVEGRPFDPSVDYTMASILGYQPEGYTTSLVEGILSNILSIVPPFSFLVLAAYALSIVVLMCATMPITSGLWSSYLRPAVEVTYAVASSIISSAGGVLGRRGAGALQFLFDIVWQAAFPNEIVYASNIYEAVLRLISPDFSAILPMLRLINPDEVDRLQVPTSLIFFLQITDFISRAVQPAESAYGTALRTVPLLDPLIHRALLPFMRLFIAPLEADTNAPYPVLIGRPLAESLNVTVGDEVLLFPESVGRGGRRQDYASAYISGVYDMGLEDLEQWKLFIPQESLREMMGYGDKEGALILVRGTGESDALSVAREMNPDMAAFTWEDYAKLVYGNALFTAIDVILLISVIALLGAIIAISSTMDSMVRRKTREIGFLKAYGLTDSGAMNIINLQALTIGITAGVISLVAYAVIWSGMSMGFITPLWAVMCVLIPLITSTLGALAPAVRISRLDPVVALREGEREI
jgi:ABC-type lipoprotein release transport system permease subunit